MGREVETITVQKYLHKVNLLEAWSYYVPSGWTTPAALYSAVFCDIIPTFFDLVELERYI